MWVRRVQKKLLIAIGADVLHDAADVHLRVERVSRAEAFDLGGEEAAFLDLDLSRQRLHIEPAQALIQAQLEVIGGTDDAADGGTRTAAESGIGEIDILAGR